LFARIVLAGRDAWQRVAYDTDLIIRTGIVAAARAEAGPNLAGETEKREIFVDEGVSIVVEPVAKTDFVNGLTRNINAIGEAVTVVVEAIVTRCFAQDLGSRIGNRPVLAKGSGTIGGALLRAADDAWVAGLCDFATVADVVSVVDRSVTVIVDGVAELGGVRIDRRVAIVAVT
jgi:hypothetical protein